MDAAMRTSCTTITNSDATKKRSSNDTSMDVPKKVARREKFQDTWLEDPIFGTWLQRCDDNPHNAKCIACNKTLSVGKYNLRVHNSTATHKWNIRRKERKGELLQLRSTTLKKDVKMKELHFVLVEHNKSFQSHKDFDKLKRTKISAIIKNVFNASIVSRATEV